MVEVFCSHTEALDIEFTPLPVDVPAALARAINQGSSREMPSQGDVILFIKKYISDDELSQEPMLVLKESRARDFVLNPQTKTLV